MSTPDMRETSTRLQATARAQYEQEQQGKAQRKTEALDHLAGCRAIQFRTRLAAIERKLFSLRAHLRYWPQDTEARAEAEQLQAMYSAMLDGNAP
jgi:hypothetical protein